MTVATGTSKVEIIAQAFTLIGVPRPINDLGSNPAITSVIPLYDTWLGKTLSSFSWRFASTIFKLDLKSSAPANSYWKYAYQFPDDFYKMNKLLLDGQKDVFKEFDIYGDEIWANQPNLLIEYVSNPGESLFPGYFVTYMTTLMASLICMPKTRNAELTKYYQTQAAEEEKIAKNLDSKSVPTRKIIYNRIALSKFGEA